MTPRSSLTATLMFSITATLGAAACDRALPIGSIPGEFHHDDGGGSGGSFGSGGSSGSGGSLGLDADDGLRALEVAPGSYHVCARLGNGSVRCWGDNQLGELGDGTTATSDVPRVVPGILNAASIQASYGYSCAIMADGTARCWGSDRYGQFGDGATTTAQLTPTTAFGGATVRQLALGEYFACALYDDRHMACSGLNNFGQLGDGTTTERHTPVAVPGLADVAEIGAGSTFACALLADKTVYCWGDAHIIDPCASNDAPPVGPTLVGVTDAIKLAVGGGHACALTSGQSVTCWGSNLHGQLGTPAPSGQTCGNIGHGPMVIPSAGGVRAVSAGDSHTCVIMNGDSPRCWGSNQYGQLGDGTTTDNDTPAIVPLLPSGVAQIAAGYMDTCTISSYGAVSCWGAVNPFFSSVVNLTPTPVSF